MGKISPVSAKYIINASINIEGVVDKPDVIGAVFGQTEGLLGSDLELRELQRSGKIGRIEVDVNTRQGKTQGSIIIPSSLDKAETAIIGASLETIERIGPCNALIKVGKIEDVRIAKREFVLKRARELLKNLMENIMPDSQELSDEVAQSVRVMEITEYGKDKLPAGPALAESDEIIVVEGRADVVNLLKYGIKNTVAMNGTSVPQTIIELAGEKIVTVFVDGDRGGNLILKEIMSVADVDYVTKAPDGKEVEELTKKEVHKALRWKVAAEQARHDLGGGAEKINSMRDSLRKNDTNNKFQKNTRNSQNNKTQSMPRAPQKVVRVSPDQKIKFKSMLEELVGTRGAYIVDKDLNILGKVPLSELPGTLKSLGSVEAAIFDGFVEDNLVDAAERSRVKFLVGMDNNSKKRSRVNILTLKDL